MIVFAALVPHPPLSLPEVGKENLQRIRQTSTAFTHLAAELYAVRPDSLIIIGNHGRLLKESFTINQWPKLHASFAEFGDLTDEVNVKNDLGLGYRLREGLETKQPLMLTENQELPHALGVPLWQLLPKMPNLHVVPLGYCQLTGEKHYAFGQDLRQVLEKYSERVAIVASGELKTTATIQNGIAEAIKKPRLADLLALTDDEKPLELNGLIMLLGLLDSLPYQVKLLGFESPFEVGYLTVQFELG